eukprot:gene1128-12716_t
MENMQDDDLERAGTKEALVELVRRLRKKVGNLESQLNEVSPELSVLRKFAGRTVPCSDLDDDIDIDRARGTYGMVERHSHRHAIWFKLTSSRISRFRGMCDRGISYTHPDQSRHISPRFLELYADLMLLDLAHTAAPTKRAST